MPPYQTQPTYHYNYVGGIIPLVLCIWVIVDSVQRGRGPLEAIGYGLFTLCCCIVGFPVYLLVRNSQGSNGY